MSALAGFAGLEEAWVKKEEIDCCFFADNIVENFLLQTQLNHVLGLGIGIPSLSPLR